MASIPIRRGTTLTFSMVLYADNNAITAHDLTGGAVTLVDSTFPVVPTIVVVDPVANLVTVTLLDLFTANLVLNKSYSFSLKALLPSNEAELYGPFSFTVTA